MRLTTYGLLRCRVGSCQPRLHARPIHRHLSSSANGRSLLTLAIETSCDDSCVAVLEKSGSAARLLFNKKITSDHRAYGGVHPLVAAETHSANLALLVKEALGALPAETKDGRDGLPVRDAETGETTRRRIPDFVSVTRGPGMKSSLAIGLSVAKGLSVAWQVPLLGVHHMQAHALTPRLVDALEQPWPAASDQPSLSSPSPSPSPSPQTSPAFPFMNLLVSGGHTQLILSRSLTEHTLLADTPTAALGDMLDKCARVILPPELTSSLPNVMYGAALEQFAFPSDPDGEYMAPPYSPPRRRAQEIAHFKPQARDGLPKSERDWFLTPPLAQSRAMTYDFAGLNGQVQKIVTQDHADLSTPARRMLAYGAMKLAFEHLASRVVFALDDMAAAAATPRKRAARPGHQRPPSQTRTPTRLPVRTLVVSGGVASNRFLRRVLREVLDVRGYHGVELLAPPVELCTDNAAMIAWTGMEMYELGWRSGLEICPVRKWSMDPTNPANKDEEGWGGLRGSEGGRGKGRGRLRRRRRRRWRLSEEEKCII
ncbi:tRNA N6-adenosine threonylcarbamoyltransferase, mitochondrial [Madurella mycetomatis]|uniref:N(6)-L-threonylcarbamoyladenine synthase n=1 Tax=Madurella mycetomatis TaxID=100816 RepID=A0A175W002_9PEZI|nr:tRNA N6-adenosine threonylcarbamoyltransferase, mitochondrial [Madurella mycetomatis]KXX77038.1 tRNA N6-adenosine threonylcarbamoyltransferase, mitochondrial [Madurella mycetomatis]